MIELRWLEKETGKTLMCEFGFYYPETTKTLQYRQQVAMTNYSQLIEPNSECFLQSKSWSDWQDVPVVRLNNPSVLPFGIDSGD